MKKYILLYLITGLVITVTGQSTAGITGKADTSFSVINEYNKLIKSYPGLKMVTDILSGNVSIKKNITYCNIDDRKLLLDVFYPTIKSTKKRTAIILIHGGGWRTGNKKIHHSLAQRLSELGYVCFTPAYRLSTEALYPAAIYDLKSAIRWVREHAKEYQIDTEKIVVAGHSAGGELAAFMGVTNNNVEFEMKDGNSNASSAVNAVVDMDGILAFIHPESGEGDDSKQTSAATYWFGYSKEENPDLWKRASPLTYAAKQNPPILFLNSSVARMHAGRDDYIKIMNDFGIYTEVHEFENAPHSFCLFEPWIGPTVQYIDNFLKKVFKQ